jgi:uncharacterized protein YprB with RNaseH-like and TPR domain
MRILYLDIESTSTKADVGRIIAIGVLSDETPEVRFSGTHEGERDLLEWLSEKIEGADLIVTWYGSGFDIPFILSRSLVHGVDLTGLAEVPMLDLCEWSKANLLLSSYKLSSVARFLGIHEASDLVGPDVLTLFKLWERGNREVTQLIVDHCREDLLMLKRVHERLKQQIRHSEGSAPKT